MTLGGGSLQVSQSVRSSFLISSISLLGFAHAKSGLRLFLLAFSTLAHTSRLMFGGAIPDNKYNSSTLVGLRHPVIARHALLSSESSL